MGKVHVVKITTANFEALQYKDSETLYFVNDSGSFDPYSMETNGKVYLGDKLLTSLSDVVIESGKKIYYNGQDVSDNANLGAIIANAKANWYGSQESYNRKVTNGTLQQNVAYHVDVQPDYNVTDPTHLGYIKNLPPIMDMNVVESAAVFYYRQRG